MNRRLGLGARMFGYGAAAIVMAAVLYGVLVNKLFIPWLVGEEKDQAQAVVAQLVEGRELGEVSRQELDALSASTGLDVRLRPLGDPEPLFPVDAPVGHDAELLAPPCRFVVPIHRDGRLVGHGVVLTPTEGPPPASHLVILALAVGAALGSVSVFVTRTLTRPLSRLATTARAFGSGDLSARAGLRRADELGEVGAAFDRMAEQITQLVGWQRELLQNVSHELRTPLTRIRIAAEVAQRPGHVSPGEALRTIEREVDDLHAVVEDLLVASRLEVGAARPAGGLPPLSRTAVAVDELLQQCGERFSRSFPGRQLHLSIPELPLVDADAALLKRALDNLLDNAGKYSDPGSRVDVVAQRRDSALWIRIADEGVGIAPDDLANLGSAFFRADRSRSRGTGGVGLGFLLARRVAEAHGGTLRVQSEIDRGTTVELSLPVEG